MTHSWYLRPHYITVNFVQFRNIDMNIHSVNLEWYNTKYKQVLKQIIDLSKRQWRQ